MRLIKLTRRTGINKETLDEIKVNPEHIVLVSTAKRGQRTVLTLAHFGQIEVVESSTEILAQTNQLQHSYHP